MPSSQACSSSDETYWELTLQSGPLLALLLAAMFKALSLRTANDSVSYRVALFRVSDGVHCWMSVTGLCSTAAMFVQLFRTQRQAADAIKPAMLVFGYDFGLLNRAMSRAKGGAVQPQYSSTTFSTNLSLPCSTSPEAESYG